MSYVLTPDWSTLPTALLPIAKDHLRITFSDDDASITRFIGFAIGYFEKFTGQAVFSGSVAWSPDLSTGASRYQCPLQPVASFTITSVAGGGDVAAQYRLEAASPVEPVWLARIDGTAFHSDAVIGLVVGHASAITIDPSMLGTILRVTGTLYEHRESISAITIEQVPFWLNDLMGGHWIPRA
jgi:uncharacterized phiE125 gp8 family phage protein